MGDLTVEDLRFLEQVTTTNGSLEPRIFCKLFTNNLLIHCRRPDSVYGEQSRG